MTNNYRLLRYEESLNAYVHNKFFYPKADNLITGWNNIESFFYPIVGINKE